MLHGLTIAFDLDGTLVETAPDLIAAANHVFQREGLDAVAPHVIRDQISFGARAMIVKGIEHQGAKRTTVEIDALLADFLAHYEANIAVHSRPFPNVLAVLENCRSRGARLVVCTNKRAYLSEELLAALDMRQHFEAIAGRDTFAVCKPHPDHLLGAIAMAGGNPGRAIMVGDSDTDISTARAAGIPSIAVTFGYTDVPAIDLGANEVIEHYDQFDGALGRIVAGLPKLAAFITHP
jgi:phosphoglycolate phosphatase